MSETQVTQQELVEIVQQRMIRAAVISDVIGFPMPQPDAEGNLPDAQVVLTSLAEGMEALGLDLDNKDSEATQAFSSELSSRLSQNPDYAAAFGYTGDDDAVLDEVTNLDEFAEGFYYIPLSNKQMNALFYDIQAQGANATIIVVGQQYGVEVPADGINAEYVNSVMDAVVAQTDERFETIFGALGATDEQVEAVSAAFSAINGADTEEGVVAAQQDFVSTLEELGATEEQIAEIGGLYMNAPAALMAVEESAIFLSNPKLDEILNVSLEALAASAPAAGESISTASAEPQPDRDISPYIDDSKFVQETVARSVNVLKTGDGLDMSSSAKLTLALTAFHVDRDALPEMSRTDGEWDAASLASLNSLTDTLKTMAQLDDQFPDSGYSPELGAALIEKFDGMEEGMAKDLFNSVLPGRDARRLIETLNSLHAANELRPVEMVTPASSVADAAAGVSEEATAQTEAVSAQSADAPEEEQVTAAEERSIPSIEKDIAVVETIMVGLGEQLGDQADDIAGNVQPILAKFTSFGVPNGIADTLVNPITSADGEWGQDSQEMFAKLMVGVKVLNGQVDPERAVQNPNGTYDANALRFAVLTNPMFAEAREIMGGIPQLSVEDANQYLSMMGPPGFGQDPAARAQFLEQEHNAGYRALEEFIARTDRIHAADAQYADGRRVLDDAAREEARKTDTIRLMLGAAGDMFGTGWIGTIKELLGDWLEPILMIAEYALGTTALGEFFGFDNDTMIAEDLRPKMHEQFGEIYDKTAADMQAETGSAPDHDAVIAGMFENLDETLKKFTDSHFGRLLTSRMDDPEIVQTIMRDAMRAAEDASTKEAAQEAFAASVVASAQAYDARRELNESAPVAETATPMASAAGADAQVTRADYRPGETGGSTSHTHSRSEAGRVADDTRSALRATAPTGGSTTTTEYVRSGVKYDFTPDSGPYVQLDRWANDRVAPIADVFERNYSAMKFSTQDVSVLDGQRYMTPAFLGFMEEAFVRAQIDEQLQAGVGVDALDLDSIDHKFDGTQDLDTVLNYMRRSGVSEVDISTVAENVMSLDQDYRSPNAPGGGDHTYSVWDHSNILNSYTRDGARAGVSRDGNVFADEGQVDPRLIVEEIRREIETPPAPAAPEEPYIATTVPEPSSDEPYIATTEPEPRGLQPGDPGSYTDNPPRQSVRCQHVETFNHLAPVTDQFDGMPGVNVEGELNRQLVEALPSLHDANPLQDPLKNVLEAAIPRGRNGVLEGYAILNPRDFDINIPGVDLVVAYQGKNSNGMDIRYVNYERDGIRDIAEHGRSGDYGEAYSAQRTLDGDRRLDEVLAVHRRPQGAGLQPVYGEPLGYRGIGVVGPAQGITGYGIARSAFDYVYGSQGNETLYNTGNDVRVTSMLQYENYINNAPGDKTYVFDPDRHTCQPTSPRGQFMNATGHAPQEQLAYPNAVAVGSQLPGGGMKPGVPGILAPFIQLDALGNIVTGRVNGANPLEQLLGLGGSNNSFDPADGWVGYPGQGHPAVHGIQQNMYDMGVSAGQGGDPNAPMSAIAWLNQAMR